MELDSWKVPNCFGFCFICSPPSVIRFCVSVKRENYPPDPPQPSASPPHPLTSLPSPCPAHTLSLYPPLTAANLLPCDIQFYLPYNGVRKIIRMGREIAVYSVSRHVVSLPVSFYLFPLPPSLPFLPSLHSLRSPADVMILITLIWPRSQVCMYYSYTHTTHAHTHNTTHTHTYTIPHTHTHTHTQHQCNTDGSHSTLQ